MSIFQLYETFQDLLEARSNVISALRDEKQMPLLLPQFESTASLRDIAVTSLTQIYILKDRTHLADAGVICVSPDTADKISSYNRAKDSFKKSVLDIRSANDGKDITAKKISRLIRTEVSERGYRTEPLKAVLDELGITALDLKKTYAHIRSMPAPLLTLRWTWATNHTRIKKVTYHEAVKMAEALGDDHRVSVALNLLGKCKRTEVFAKKVDLPNQLRANYTYKDDDLIIRGSTPISGIVAVQQDQLPETLWRDNPEEEKKKIIRDSTLEDEPFIFSLNLYRYK